MLTAIAHHPAADTNPPREPVTVMTGGAPPSPALLARLAELHIDVTHAYGMTETFGQVMLCDGHREGDRLVPEERTRLKARAKAWATSSPKRRGLSTRSARPARDARHVDRGVLARRLLHCLLRQIMLDGVFHADPHPGNVLLLADGRIGLLDFGSVGRLDALVRDALRQLLMAIELGDPAAVSAALLELAQHPDDVDEQDLARAVGRFMARHLGPGAGPNAAMFTELFGS